MEHEHESDGDRGTKSRSAIAFTVFLIIGVVFLVAEHRAHLIGWIPYWPYLLLLACPLMHLFMHGGHGHGSHGTPREKSAQSAGERK